MSVNKQCGFCKIHPYNSSLNFIFNSRLRSSIIDEEYALNLKLPVCDMQVQPALKTKKYDAFAICLLRKGVEPGKAPAGAWMWPCRVFDPTAEII